MYVDTTCVFMSPYMCACMPIVGVSGAWDLESQAVVSCLMLVLRIEPRSSARAIQALNHCAISPTFTCMYIFVIISF